MNEDLHNIDKLFKDALNGLDEEPGADVWKNIDCGIDRKTVISVNRKYRRLKWTAAALLLFACGMAMYVYTKNSDNRLVKAGKTKEVKTENKNAEPGSGVNSSSGATNNSSSHRLKTSAETLNKDALRQHEVNTANSEAESTITKKRSTLAGGLNKKAGRQMWSSGSVIADTKHGRVKDTAGSELESQHLVAGRIFVGINSNEQNSNAIAEHRLNSIRRRQASDKKSSSALNKNVIGYSIKPNVPEPQMAGVNGTIEVEPALKNTTPIVLNIADIGVALTFSKLFDQHGAGSVKSASSNSNSSPFSITVYFSPDFISNRVQQDRRMFREDDRNEISKSEKNRFSSTFGAFGEYNFNANWSIQAGLALSTTVKDIEEKNIFARPDNRGNVRYRINCSAGYSYINIKSTTQPSSGDSIRILRSKNVLQYMSVPLALKYHFSKGNFTVSPGAGFSVNILTKGKIETAVANGVNNELQVLNDIEGLKTSYINGLFSLAAEYNLTKTIAFSLMPSARFAITSINRDSPVKSYQNSFSIGAGLRFKL